MINKYLLILFAILFASSMKGQNPMFFSFGQSSHGIFRQVEEVKGAKTKSLKAGSIEASWRKANFDYEFHRDRLFDVRMERYFDKRREAKKSFQDCLAYFDHIQAKEVSEVEAGREVKEYIFTWEARVYWLVYRSLPGGRASICLQSRHLAYTPLDLWTEAEHKISKEYGLHTPGRSNLPFSKAGRLDW